MAARGRPVYRGSSLSSFQTGRRTARELSDVRQRVELAPVPVTGDCQKRLPCGFSNAVALLGSHFNGQQQAQLADGRSRTIYLCLDSDANGSGQGAARLWRQRLSRSGQRIQGSSKGNAGSGKQREALHGFSLQGRRILTDAWNCWLGVAERIF